VKASIHSGSTVLKGLLAGLAVGLVTVPAYAVLGGAPMTTPENATLNRAVTHAAKVASGASAASSSSYTVRSTTLVTGTVVNEYLASDGTVFGIAWQGSQIPNLVELLGSYFPQYLQGIQAERAKRGGRGPANVTDAGLVVHSGGHMGSFIGQAYLPQALPAGVSAADIQ
jgi:hypothetical protein